MQNETGAVPPEHQVNPKWAEAFASQLVSTMRGMQPGKVVEHTQQIDPADLCTPELAEQCESAVALGRDFFKKGEPRTGELVRVEHWFPRWSNANLIGTPSQFEAILSVSWFTYGAEKETRFGAVEKRRVVTKSAFVPAKRFFSEYEATTPLPWEGVPVREV